MKKAFSRVRLIMLGIFALTVAGIWGYQILYAMPKERCDQSGLWWAGKWRSCVAPVDITTLTGRPVPGPVAPGVQPKPVAAPPAVK